MRAAFGSSFHLGADTDSELFDYIFHGDIYTAWETGSNAWQLHCHGSPGCGKTTFAAVTADHIRESSYDSSTVVTIFILDNPEFGPTAFIEDMLYQVCEQLCEQLTEQRSDQLSHEGAEDGSNQAAYTKIALPDKQYTKMKSFIHKFTSTRPTYLILDGYDRLNEVVQKQLDHELHNLQEHKLRLMLTRRVPAWSPLQNNECDSCYRRDIMVYWVCQECEANGEDFILCYGCHIDPMRGCNRHPDAQFEEGNYDHVDLEVNIDTGRLKGYLIDRLEMEWPELDLRTCRNITKFVIDYCCGNITIARLYLEEYLNEDKAPNFDSSNLKERLPSNVIAYLESDLSVIDPLEEHQRILTFQTLHEVASAGASGVPLSTLANKVWPEKMEEEGLKTVLTLANGWLLQSNTESREIQFCCGDVFRRYVLENYNESIARMRQLAPGEEALGIRFAHREALRESTGSSYDMMSDIITPGTTFDSTQPKARQQSHMNSSSSPNIINESAKIVQSPPRMTSDETVPTISHPSMEHGLQRISTPKLCNFCIDNILNTSVVSGTHRIALDDDESVLELCMICRALYHDIVHMKKPSFCRIQWPLYRWALQKTTSSRQSEGSMVLSFRPLYADMSSKRFHLISKANMPDQSELGLGPTTKPELEYVGKRPGAQIQKWIQSCDNAHDGCSKWEPGDFLPTRLLDLQDVDMDIIRLVNKNHVKVEGPYCTLSHMWGPNDFLTTTPENIEEIVLRGIKLSPSASPNISNNKTFLDAIKVARFLKIRYIWIDSLCIIQGPRGDFNVEGGLMHQVYRNTYCNIVAAGLPGGERGLFCAAREPETILPVIYKSNETGSLLGKGEWTIMSSDMWASDLLASVIYTRGWVFQERMLSPRLLHFTQNQIFWDCCTTSASETLPTGLPLPLDRLAATDRHWRGRLNYTKNQPSKVLSGPIDNESSDTFWLSAIEYYTSCNLTNQGDKSVAIWSVAKILRDIFNEKYAKGMWSNNLEEQLAWRVKDVNKCERPWDLSSLPSWSWTSVKGSILPQHRVTYRTYRVKDPKGKAIAFDSKDSNDDRDQEPTLSRNTLAISGYIHDGRIEVRGSTRDKYTLKIELENRQYVLLDAFPDEDPWKNKRLYSNCKFVLLAASKTIRAHQSKVGNTNDTYVGLGLILSPKSDMRISTVENCYRRIGAVHFREVGEQAFRSLRNGVPSNFSLE